MQFVLEWQIHRIFAISVTTKDKFQGVKNIKSLSTSQLDFADYKNDLVIRCIVTGIIDEINQLIENDYIRLFKLFPDNQMKPMQICATC